MQAPTCVSVQDINGAWHVVDTLPPKWSTVAPGGCLDATITLADGQRAPELQQGCQVRITTADSADAVWSGRLSQPVRRVIGSQTQWELPVEGTATFMADRNLKYAPAVTRYDAWQLGSTMGPYRAGAGVSSGPIPKQTWNNFEVLMLTLPQGYIVPNDRSLARFNGYDDNTMRPYAISATHVEGVFSRNLDKFFVFLWHGQPDGTVQWLDRSTQTPALMQQMLDPDDISDVVLGWQFLGPATDTNQDTSEVTNNELYAAWYYTTVWAELFDVDGTRLDYAPFTDGLKAAHVVRDLIGRGFMPAVSNDAMVTQIAVPSQVQLASFEYTGLVTAADILNDLVSLEPDYLWWAGPADASTGDVPFTWDMWPAMSLLLPPGVVVYDESGSDADLANAVQFTYTASNGKPKTILVTVDASDYPDTAALPGLVEAPPLDLTSMTDGAACRQIAGAYLAMYATLPKSATATVSTPVPDKVTGERIQPWHLHAGTVAHVPETGDDLKVTKVEVDASTATAVLTLGTPRKTVADLVAQMTNRRRKES